MKIMIFSNSSYGGWGYGVVSKYVAKGLREHGFNPILFGMQTIGRIIEDEYGQNKSLLSEIDQGSERID